VLAAKRRRGLPGHHQNALIVAKVGLVSFAEYCLDLDGIPVPHHFERDSIFRTVLLQFVGQVIEVADRLPVELDQRVSRPKAALAAGEPSRTSEKRTPALAGPPKSGTLPR